jgi:hypothetical protein
VQLVCLSLIAPLGAAVAPPDEPPLFPAPHFPAGDGAFHAALADVDGDRITDVLTSNELAGTPRATPSR